MKPSYKQVPGRGLMSQTAYELRMDYLDSLVDDIGKDVQSKSICLDQVQNNIESFIGTIEIPLGLVGPLLFKEKNEEPEYVHGAVATTEGALVASMNRGAKAISESGGFKAHIVHQKMLRTPMFTFSSMGEALEFDQWIKTNFLKIKEVAQKHSNHADLLEITSVLVGKIIHLKFIYSTKDASGQNMTTSCTWNACLWIEEVFQEEKGIEIIHFVIEGNGASDKKVSHYSMQNGRGTHVISECFLTNEIIEKTLRTNADDLYRSFQHSMAIGVFNGMIGYNVNVANTIAGIFGSTGQDLACIHESSTALLQMEKEKEGIYLSLTLPNLVVGTVGGGTHLPVASKILELMNCKGAGKVGRFAKLIAGFALSLEISTMSAIVSGQFARAHQKLGRNKPVKWLLKSEINTNFFKQHLPHLKHEIVSTNLASESKLDNGILTSLTSKISKKLIGFIPADLVKLNNEKIPVLIKSKALGSEVLDGLHFMSCNLSAALADCLNTHRKYLEYNNCHEKEIQIYTFLEQLEYAYIPTLHGSVINKEREIYLLINERLKADDLLLFNSEDSPSLWTREIKLKAIDAIHQVHRASISREAQKFYSSLPVFDVTKSLDLYSVFTTLNRKEYDYLQLDSHFNEMLSFIHSWKENKPLTKGKKTLVHNDFNPRNIAIRSTGEPRIYDWELAVIDLPQRDLFEFLAFTFDEGFDTDELIHLLKYHYDLVLDFNDDSYLWEDYLDDFKLAGQSFILARLNFYLAGNTLVNYSFIERVFKVSFQILNFLK